MKIGFFEVKKWERPVLKRLMKGYDVEFFSEPLTEKNFGEAKKFDIVSTFIYSKISRNVIKNLPKLKMVSTRSTGFDHIDVEFCKKKKIVVCNVPYYGENTVAEHTFALILTLSRNVHKFYNRVKRKNFSIEGLMGFDLKGKTIGVIGAGHIGLHVIRIAKGFGMNVLAYDVKKDTFLSEVLGFKYVELEELLKKSDIITLHVPLNKHTYHLINKKNIKLIKKGALLINTSRGEVVDTEALLYALNKKILSGAGLDVIEGEKLIKEEKQILYEDVENLKTLIRDFNILERDNVVFTPHIAFYSKEALMRIINTTVENIKLFIEDHPQNVVE